MSRKKHQTYEGLGKKSQEKFTVKKGLSKKKKEQKDFQKVKLKAGKLRPKGLNETKLEFQSKSIVIREQLRQELGPERIQVTSPSPTYIFVFSSFLGHSPSLATWYISSQTRRPRRIENTAAE